MQGNVGSPNQTVLSSNSGVTTYAMAQNSHTHANWDFSTPGYYTLNITYASKLGTDTEDIHVAVGDDVDPWQAPASCQTVKAPAKVDSAKLASTAQAASANNADGGAKPLTPLESKKETTTKKPQAQKKSAVEPTVITVPEVTNIMGRHPVTATTLVAGGSILSTLCVVFTGFEMRRRLAGQ